ncbi:MAG: hypothetical protein A2161_13730 [Candidatus Schekmanbacteria bacterium RBG_13_48_7]|uniref:Uncharacterized protein n=1 Tax=Candidatus Schekmanbacteria bacterium RBG_13_48_7 TaxID=1817878 RepID=A0A1F7RZV1_9BACT|nr:MAG: hypothetical protein A2161_13730 [Candidatus Schekmanbacteria bacterium RBG_13_48_7]
MKHKSTFRKNNKTTNPIEHFKNHLADADYSFRDFYQKYYLKYDPFGAWQLQPFFKKDTANTYRYFCYTINRDGIWTESLQKAYSDFCLDFP